MCTTLTPDSSRAESIIWTSLFAPRSPNLTGPYERHGRGSRRGLLFCISSWCRREQRLVPHRSAWCQGSIYTALVGWNSAQKLQPSLQLSNWRGVDVSNSDSHGVFPAKMTIILILRGGELPACFVCLPLHQLQDSYTSSITSFVMGF